MLTGTTSPNSTPSAKTSPETLQKPLGGSNKVADQGFVEAQYPLGLDYAQGLGLATNDSLSSRWLRAAHTPQQES